MVVRPAPNFLLYLDISTSVPPALDRDKRVNEPQSVTR